MPLYKVNVVWSEMGSYLIGAATPEEAESIANELALPHPRDSYFLEGSFEIDSIEIIDDYETED